MIEINIDDLNLSNRSKNALKDKGIINIGDFMQLNEESIESIRNIGEKSRKEIIELKNKLEKNENKIENLFNKNFKEIIKENDIKCIDELYKLDVDSNPYKVHNNDIENTTLSRRSKNQLRKNGYISIDQLQDLTVNDLNKIRNLGAKSIQEIIDFKENISGKCDSNIGFQFDLPIEKSLSMDIENILNSKELLRVLKSNNIKLVNTLLELTTDDIKKLRGIDNKQAKELYRKCEDVRLKLNLLNGSLFTEVIRRPYQTIEDIIKQTTPKSIKKMSSKFLFKNRYVNKIDIEEFGFTKKEKRFIYEYELNNIDSLLSITYNDLQSKSHVSKKTVNSVLSRLTELVVVQNKSGIYYGELSRIYISESNFNYLALMSESTFNGFALLVLEILENNSIDKNLPIKQKLELLRDSEQVTYDIKHLNIDNATMMELIYAIVKKYNGELDEKKLISITEKHFKMTNVNNLISRLKELRLIKVLNSGNLVFEKQSILHFVERNYDLKTTEIMKSRLEGKTLEEIGDVSNITRERVRQIIKKIIGDANQEFREDRNAYWYCEYDLSKEQYEIIFGDNSYYYLQIKYNKGSKDWKSILEDEKASKEIKRNVKAEILKNSIDVGNKVIAKNKISIIDYVLEEYGQTPMHIDEIYELIYLFLEDRGIDKVEYNIDKRYLENRLNENINSVSRGKKYYRYYDYSSYDWDYFYKEINLKEWENLEISTLIIYQKNETLMKKYNIMHENELHNIIRRTVQVFDDLIVKVTRMPNLSIGTVDREQQVKDLMYEYEPINIEEFAIKYYETYGVKIPTVKANYMNYLDQYMHGDIISSNNTHIDTNDFEKVKQALLDRDFAFIEDLKSLVGYDIKGLALILKKLKYKVFTSYIIKSRYRTVSNYFDEVYFFNQDIINFNDIDKRVWNLSAFGSWLYEKNIKLELLEFSPKKYISRKKLNEIGLSLEVLREYQDKVVQSIDDDRIWPIESIVELVDNKDIDSFGFDFIFYRSLLRGVDKLFCNQMGGNYLFKLNSDFNMREIIEQEVIQVKAIDIFLLTETINKKYNLDFKNYKLIEVIKHSDMYYNEIMEKVYLDVNYYYEEFE
ncbi:DNA-directed RNA polymerase subunit alpha C-terminal domain-containing protein [Staphylococcus chromogenes]|uniref:DNA-directed RNA polymerase subunit alpha C-terminal domain-containing protein n=1 Tax=Staphylococcus chromogenes TaxID=46126 RepID=UPI0028887256|nr:DNA-directed RNA polymerase subunit alpha C-terminal domain-containing protein [Staphylococcus chromogenes]MDT0672640.1 DNA-directed RNA polymerase subunit alpha C-terminal domain-containing protein [Staphylococcus chromogenes]MDT0674879.1 DNA-directed RNA polymerase subunit alpha C-terminal domain-containing protein [Staphylococcus chromogenes]